MKIPSRARLFKKVLVPIVHNCEQTSAVNAARMIAGEGSFIPVGLVYIPEGELLSGGAVPVQEVRQMLRRLSSAKPRTEVYATHRPWDEIVRVTEKEKPDLLILEYPFQFETLNITLAEVLSYPPCDIAIVNSHVPDSLNSVLIPMRGGPYAELALRIALAMRRFRKIDITSLHMVPTNPERKRDAAFRGIQRVLKNLPEVREHNVATDNSGEALFETSRQFDLTIMGASARSAEEVASIGPVVEQMMKESEHGLIVVKTKQPLRFSLESEEAGQTAISVLVDKWFAENTFHADEFQDLDYLLSLKRERGVSISLALPALNEEETVGNVIQTIKQSLVLDAPLLDEIVLINSDSEDRTKEIAQELGIPVYVHQAVLPKYGARRGKGKHFGKACIAHRAIS